MTYAELKDTLDKMDDDQLAQTVYAQFDTENWFNITLAITFDGKAVLIADTENP